MGYLSLPCTASMMRRASRQRRGSIESTAMYDHGICQGFSPEVISSRIAIPMSRIHRGGRTPARRENAPEPLLVLRPMPKARAPRQKRFRDYVREKHRR
jgi:hypothetical protein